MKPIEFEYLDFYWGIDEEFELNDYLEDELLTAMAKAYVINNYNVTAGMSGYIRRDGYIFAEPIDENPSD